MALRKGLTGFAIFAAIGIVLLALDRTMLGTVMLFVSVPVGFFAWFAVKDRG
jgi:hypothetical protein